MNPDTLKTKIAEAVDGLADELEALSHRIHANPELAYQEEQASAWLCEFLAQKGLRVERGVGGLPTAFRATSSTAKRPTPRPGRGGASTR